MGQKMVIKVTRYHKESIMQQSDPKGKFLATFFYLPFFSVQFYIRRKSKHECLTDGHIKKWMEGSLAPVSPNYSWCSILVWTAPRSPITFVISLFICLFACFPYCCFWLLPPKRKGWQAVQTHPCRQLASVMNCKLNHFLTSIGNPLLHLGIFSQREAPTLVYHMVLRCISCHSQKQGCFLHHGRSVLQPLHEWLHQDWPDTKFV